MNLECIFLLFFHAVFKSWAMLNAAMIILMFLTFFIPLKYLVVCAVCFLMYLASSTASCLWLYMCATIKEPKFILDLQGLWMNICIYFCLHLFVCLEWMLLWILGVQLSKLWRDWSPGCRCAFDCKSLQEFVVTAYMHTCLVINEFYVTFH